MSEIDRGVKHTCPECATKYYDLKKDVVTCPKCGAKPPAPPKPKPPRSGGRMPRVAMARYP